MAVPYIFASNPDNLAQQRGFYDNINLRLAEEDRAARQKAFDTERENYFAAARMAQENARNEAESANRFAAHNYNIGLDRQDRAMRLYQFGLGRGDMARQEKESNRRYGLETGFKNRELAANEGRLRLAGEKEANDLAFAKQSQLEDLKQQQEDVQSALSRANIIVNAGNPMPPPAGNWYTLGMTKSQPPRKLLTEDEAFGHALRDKTLAPYVDLFLWDTPSQKFTLRDQSPALYNFGATNSPATNALPPMTNSMPATLLPPQKVMTLDDARANAPMGLPFADGAVIRNRQDGKLYKVVNGRPELLPIQ